MYYKLKAPYSFRGWRKLPYAIRAEYGAHMYDRPRFFKKDLFMELLYLNGTEEVDPRAMSDKFRSMVGEMVESGMVESSEEPMTPLEPWQRYHVFPSRFIESVHWAITGKCNFRCRHCLVSAPDAHHPQLPLPDLLRIADEIAACGIKAIDVTGGEPLARNDFAQVVRGLAERDLHIRILFTNASLLTADVLDALLEHGHTPNFQLSFDGLGHHDWLRGIAGAEAQADAAFRLLQERGVPVTAAMMIHRGNKDSLRQTVDYLAALGVKTLRVNAPQELGVWKDYSARYALSEEEVWDVYRTYIPQYLKDGSPIGLELGGFFTCAKGETEYRIPYVHHVAADASWSDIPYCESMWYNMYIRPDGRVAPCMGFSDTVLGDRFPSVLEEHLGDITLRGYYHDVVKTTLMDLIAKNPECKACEHLAACGGGCMLESITEEGDFLVPDQSACWFHKHVGEAGVREAAAEGIRASRASSSPLEGRRV